jgi:hypothetical protein
MHAMRSLIPVFVAFWTSAWTIQAQTSALELGLVMDENVFLPGEDVLVGVRIANLTGRPVTFGSTADWLRFHVETKRGEIIQPLGPVPVLGEFTLEPTQVGTKWWNIQPYFAFEGPGGYLLHVELNLPEWDQQLLSDGLAFSIQSARKIWEVAVGVPPTVGQPEAAPEIRRYALQTATRRDGRKLYARVTDESESRIYRVVLLDRMLSFDNREQQVDAASKLHVLFQTGGITYTYCALNPQGELVARQRIDITNAGRPRLFKKPDGSIEIDGGRRVPTPSDIPPYEPPPVAIATTNAPLPAVTNAPGKTSQRKASRAERRRNRANKEP